MTRTDTELWAAQSTLPRVVYTNWASPGLWRGNQKLFGWGSQYQDPFRLLLQASLPSQAFPCQRETQKYFGDASKGHFAGRTTAGPKCPSQTRRPALVIAPFGRRHKNFQNVHPSGAMARTWVPPRPPCRSIQLQPLPCRQTALIKKFLPRSTNSTWHAIFPINVENSKNL